MGRRQFPIIDYVTVHDHFAGSAHCVECNGNCVLTGAERLATEMIRFTFEALAAEHRGPNMMVQGALNSHGVDWQRLYSRAVKTNKESK